MTAPPARQAEADQLALMLLLDELSPYFAARQAALRHNSDRSLEYWFYLCDSADPPVPTEDEVLYCDSLRATARTLLTL